MSIDKVTVTAKINADIEKVWNAWTDPQHIVNWNFASEDWCCPKVENDLRPGGRYVARMEARDGSFGFDFAAIYDEIELHKKITYTMEDGRIATTVFTDKGGSVEVTTIFDAESSNPVEMQREGWQAILNNFKKYAER